MAGITDQVFRRLCFENGCDQATTEMVSAQGYLTAPKDRMAYRFLLARYPEEGPLAVQIFGSDPDCMAIFDNYVHHLCVGLSNLVNVYDPEVIALGGGVSHAGEFLLNAVRAKLPEMIFYKDMPFARIELAKLTNDAGIIGAAMLGR